MASDPVADWGSWDGVVEVGVEGLLFLLRLKRPLKARFRLSRASGAGEGGS